MEKVIQTQTQDSYDQQLLNNKKQINNPPQGSKGIDITFKNLSYTVTTKNMNKQGPSMVKRTILNNLNGICPGSQMTAILGSSGAGKTSLLNILAKRIDNSNGVEVSGEILANSKSYDFNRFASFASYVMQNDILMETMTPRESFQFVANLKYSNYQVKLDSVNETLKLLKLERCQHSMIGGVMFKGISGGERKRVSIGIELVSDPIAILLDEPTSGLDSFTAFILLNLLRKLCQEKGKTIIFTIHQPSADIYQLFDRIMLLVQGRFIYQGSRQQIIKHFGTIGFQCPQYSNPMDYFLSIMHTENPKNLESFQIYFDGYQNSLHPLVEQEIKNQGTESIVPKEVQTTTIYQMTQVAKRSILNMKRDQNLIKGRGIQSIFMGIVIGGIYFGVATGPDTIKRQQSIGGGKLIKQQMNSQVLFFLCINHLFMSLMPVMIQFPAERAVFLKEENSKLYSAVTYFIGKSTIELPIQVILPVLQEILSYWMIGLNDISASIVVIHMLIYILMSMAGNSLGLMAGCVFTDINVANGAIPMVIMPLMLFSGFYQNQDNFMSWIGWIQYISPMKYAFEASIINQYTGIIFENNLVEILGMTTGLWESIIILTAMIIFFRIVAFVFLVALKSKLQ